MSANTPVAAFFDLDKTIIATSSAFAFGKEFLNNGMITRQEAWELYITKAQYMLVGQSSERMDSTRDALSQMVAGWDVKDIQRITRDTLRKIESGNPNVSFNSVTQVLRALGILDQLVDAADPLASDIGRLRAGRLTRKRAR